MGMFDNLQCKSPLPDGSDNSRWFQTKDFDCALDNYTITAEGRLIWHKTRKELVPEEERPYFGKEEWNEPLFKMIGAIRSVPEEDVDLEWHGYIWFYDADTCYKAKFTDGQLMSIIADND
jgi:hypothetical protein